jgi:hypothetical protein
MNAIRYLKSFEEVEGLVSEIQKRRIPATLGLEPFRQEYYRGQVSDTFLLRPSLTRYLNDVESIIKVESSLMNDFQQEMIKAGKSKKILLHEKPEHFQNDWLMLGQAQHFGLPTRMLDWTIKWEVALYFAVEKNPTFDSHDSQFWVFYVPDDILMYDGKKELYYRTSPSELEDTWFVNPAFFWTDNFDYETAEVRRARQHGKFSIQSYKKALTPLEQQERMKPLLEKYCIPASSKPQIRLDLASKGVFGEFLYANEDEDINTVISFLRAKYGLQ